MKKFLIGFIGLVIVLSCNAGWVYVQPSVSTNAYPLVLLPAGQWVGPGYNVSSVVNNITNAGVNSTNAQFYTSNTTPAVTVNGNLLNTGSITNNGIIINSEFTVGTNTITGNGFGVTSTGATTLNLNTIGNGWFIQTAGTNQIQIGSNQFLLDRNGNVSITGKYSGNGSGLTNNLGSNYLAQDSGVLISNSIIANSNIVFNNGVNGSNNTANQISSVYTAINSTNTILVTSIQTYSVNGTNFATAIGANGTNYTLSLGTSVSNFIASLTNNYVVTNAGAANNITNFIQPGANITITHNGPTNIIASSSGAGSTFGFNVSQFSGTTTTNISTGVTLTNVQLFASGAGGGTTNNGILNVTGQTTLNSTLFVNSSSFLDSGNIGTDNNGNITLQTGSLTIHKKGAGNSKGLFITGSQSGFESIHVDSTGSDDWLAVVDTNGAYSFQANSGSGEFLCRVPLTTYTTIQTNYNASIFDRNIICEPTNNLNILVQLYGVLYNNGVVEFSWRNSYGVLQTNSIETTVINASSNQSSSCVTVCIAGHSNIYVGGAIVTNLNIPFATGVTFISDGSNVFAKGFIGTNVTAGAGGSFIPNLNGGGTNIAINTLNVTNFNGSNVVLNGNVTNQSSIFYNQGKLYSDYNGSSAYAIRTDGSGTLYSGALNSSSLGIIGTTSLDNGNITTDGSGNVVMKGLSLTSITNNSGFGVNSAGVLTASLVNVSNTTGTLNIIGTSSFFHYLGGISFYTGTNSLLWSIAEDNVPSFTIKDDVNQNNALIIDKNDCVVLFSNLTCNITTNKGGLYITNISAGTGISLLTNGQIWINGQLLNLANGFVSQSNGLATNLSVTSLTNVTGIFGAGAFGVEELSMDSLGFEFTGGNVKIDDNGTLTMGGNANINLSGTGGLNVSATGNSTIGGPLTTLSVAVKTNVIFNDGITLYSSAIHPTWTATNGSQCFCTDGSFFIYSNNAWVSH